MKKPPTTEPLPAFDPSLQDLALDAFEEAWQQDTPPDLRQFLAKQESPNDDSLLLELVSVDLEHRWRRAGTPKSEHVAAASAPMRPTLEWYVEQFPQLGQLTALPERLIHQEYRVRHLWGDQPSREEFMSRFGDRGGELATWLAHAEKEAGREHTSVGKDTEINPHLLGLPKDFGGYEFVEVIATGGMGVVYKARQMALDRIVAVKMIKAGNLATQTEVQRFLAEAEAAAGLDHPNIVPVHEIGQHETGPFIVMSFVAGQSLKQRVQHEPLSSREAAELIRTIAAAVQFAHDKGVIHRDLKPDNVLLSENNQPRLTDFGLAKRINANVSLTETGQLLGTPAYMSPQQASAQAVDHRTDVYSLGAMLYFTLTGRPPFEGNNVVEILKQAVDKEPTPPRRLNPSVDRDLETICLKCLEKKPDQRYSMAIEVADDLGRYLNGQSVTARQIGVVGRTWRWAKRRPSVAGLLLGGSLALVVVIGLSIWIAVLMSKSSIPPRNFPGTLAGANELLREFLEPGADRNALSLKLKPTEKDYDAVFKPEFLKKAKKYYKSLWESGARISPKMGQTELILGFATTEDLKKWNNKASMLFPGGYKRAASTFKDGLRIYRFKFVVPGERNGMAFDGLIFVNGHWRIFPKPWRMHGPERIQDFLEENHFRDSFKKN